MKKINKPKRRIFLQETVVVPISSKLVKKVKQKQKIMQARENLIYGKYARSISFIWASSELAKGVNLNE